MFNRISSFTLAILLFAVLAGSNRSMPVLIASLVILIAATFAINLRRIGLSWPHLLLPVLYLLGAGCLYMVITRPTLSVIFLVVICILFFFLEQNLGKESHFLQNIYLLSAFAIFVGIFALKHYFSLDTIWLLLITFFVTLLLIIQGFAGFSLPSKRYFNFLIALIVTQAAWGITFWPTYFVVNAIVVFCIYYLLWIFSFSAFFGKLTRKKMIWQFALVGFVLVVTLTSAAWRPLIR